MCSALLQATPRFTRDGMDHTRWRQTASVGLGYVVQGLNLVYQPGMPADAATGAIGSRGSMVSCHKSLGPQTGNSIVAYKEVPPGSNPPPFPKQAWVHVLTTQHFAIVCWVLVGGFQGLQQGGSVCHVFPEVGAVGR